MNATLGKSVGIGCSNIRAVSVGIGLTLLGLLFGGIFAVLAAAPLFLMGFEFESTPVLLALLIGSQLGFIGAGYLYVRRYRLNVHFRRIDRNDVILIAGGVIGALVFATAAFFIFDLIGVTPDAILEELVSDDPMLAIWLAILSVFIVAPAEEYLFRGVIQGRLRKSFSAPLAIVGASLLFASIHFGNFVGEIGVIVAWSLVIGGVGMIFGVLYEKTRSLTVPIIAHGLYNFIIFVTGYLML